MRTAEDPEHNDEPDSRSRGVRTLQVPGDKLTILVREKDFDNSSKVDMSKCMVAFIDWYHERFDGEGGREKIKVRTEHQYLQSKFHIY